MRSARPMGSIRSGATSSVTSPSSAPSRTRRLASGFASWTGRRRRSAEHVGEARHAGAATAEVHRPQLRGRRATTTRGRRPRARHRRRSPRRGPRSPHRGAASDRNPGAAPRASSAPRPRSRCRSSRKRRVPTVMSRVRIGTPSSRMLMLVTSWPMLISADHAVASRRDGSPRRRCAARRRRRRRPPRSSAGIGEQAHLRLDQLALGGDEQDAHLHAVGRRDRGSGSPARPTPCRTARAARLPTASARAPAVPSRARSGSS